MKEYGEIQSRSYTRQQSILCEIDILHMQNRRYVDSSKFDPCWMEQPAIHTYMYSWIGSSSYSDQDSVGPAMSLAKYMHTFAQS